MMNKNAKKNFITVKNISSVKHTVGNEKTYQRLGENNLVIINAYAIISLKRVREGKTNKQTAEMNDFGKQLFDWK